jgi:hypothetical protein
MHACGSWIGWGGEKDDEGRRTVGHRWNLFPHATQLDHGMMYYKF